MQQQIGVLVSGRLAPMIGPLLPAAEAFVAVALVAWWSPAPGVVSLVLLAAFTVVLVRAQARHVPCLCFGAAQVDAPVGPASVIRNGVLAAFAVLAIGDPSGAHAVATIVVCAAFGVVAAVSVGAAGGRARSPRPE